MRLLVTSLALLALAGCATQGQDPDNNLVHCKRATDAEVASLFERWNNALRTRNPQTVVALYSSDSLLLPTLSNQPRATVEEKLDYFRYFLQGSPTGSIDRRHVIVDCNTAVDTGLYTFRFANGSSAKARYTYTYRWDGKQWLITSHHSSALPEAVSAQPKASGSVRKNPK